MADREDNLLAAGQYEKIRTHIQTIKPVLEQEGEFRASDIDTDRDSRHSALEILRQHGAVQKVRFDKPEDGENHSNVYRWRDDVKQELKKYLNDMDKLPCGHRSHIIHHPSEDCFSCKHCDDWPEYSRETIEQCL